MADMDREKITNGESGKLYPYTNSLIHSSSPYLLEHAHNPVNWFPWGKEALKKASEENKLLIISIGYSACHWCHVMEHQSYSDADVANFMNQHFVAIKVDREERPDIDQIYMNAAMLLTGSGGWPLNAFALPDGRPFYALTYLPKLQWLELLHQIVNLYREQADKVKEQAAALTAGIQGGDLVQKPADPSTGSLKKIYAALLDRVASTIDFVHGGFGRAPKFPMPNAWELLLQYHYITGNEKALDAVMVTLDQMMMGGIYDQIGGGFARYATDQLWRVPHFERMLYDNGQLISLYAHAYQVTGKSPYADVIRKTLSFIKDEMTDNEGGFYSSINADSEGEEGKFYVWTEHEIDRLIDMDILPLIKDYYRVTKAGNWEHGKNILYRENNNEAFARKYNITTDELHDILQKTNDILLNARSQRIRPTTDNKILTSWNALMMEGYVNAYKALGDKAYLESAIANAKFIEDKMMGENGYVWRNYMQGKAAIPGLLDDYAFLAAAFIELYQVTFDSHWLLKAESIVKYAREHFYDAENHLFFYTSDQSENLIARKKEMEDNVLASSNSVMANVLYRLGIFLDNDIYQEEATAMLHQVVAAIPSGVPYFSNWARLLGLLVHGHFEVAIVGTEASEKNIEMQKKYLPDAFFMGGLKADLPLLEGKTLEGKTTIYVCKNKVCQLPVNEPAQALEQIK